MHTGVSSSWVVWQGFFERYTRVLLEASPEFPLHFLKIYSSLAACSTCVARPPCVRGGAGVAWDAGATGAAWGSDPRRATAASTTCSRYPKDFWRVAGIWRVSPSNDTSGSRRTTTPVIHVWLASCSRSRASGEAAA